MQLASFLSSVGSQFPFLRGHPDTSSTHLELVALNVMKPISLTILVLPQVGDGTVEFEPTPAESRSLIGSAYRVPYSLLVRFENDAIDETPEMAQILGSANPAGVPPS